MILLRHSRHGTIETIVEQELEEALGAARSQRVSEQRGGYRHGKRSRTLTTSLGPATIAMPRARMEDDAGRPTFPNVDLSSTRAASVRSR